MLTLSKGEGWGSILILTIADLSKGRVKNDLVYADIILEWSLSEDRKLNTIE